MFPFDQMLPVRVRKLMKILRYQPGRLLRGKLKPAEHCWVCWAQFCGRNLVLGGVSEEPTKMLLKIKSELRIAANPRKHWCLLRSRRWQVGHDC